MFLVFYARLQQISGMQVKEQLRAILKEVNQVLSQQPSQFRPLKNRIEVFLREFEQRLKTIERQLHTQTPIARKTSCEISNQGYNFEGKDSRVSERTGIDDSGSSSDRNEVDFHLLEIDHSSNSYQVHTVQQTTPTPYIHQIADLILASLPQHTRLYPQFSQISEKLSHSSPILKPIVFQLMQGQKHAFVFETKQYLFKNDAYQESDRFLVLVTSQFIPGTVTDLAKQLTKMEYQDRFRNPERKYQLDFAAAKLSSRSTLLADMKDCINSSKPVLRGQRGLLQMQRQLHDYLNQVKCYSVLTKMSSLQWLNIPLLLVLLYFVLKDFKVIMVGVKETRHIMSQAVMGLRHVLDPIRYSYPVIATSLSEDHQDYIDAPVPAILMLWGSRDLCNECIIQRRQIIDRNSSFEVPTILVDLNEKTLFNSGLSERESWELSYIRDRLSLKDQQSSEGFVDQVRRFVQSQLLGSPPPPLLQSLHSQFTQTFLYQNR